MEEDVDFGGISVSKKELFAWIFRLLLVLALLYGNANFVSKAQYVEDQRMSETRRELILKSLVDVNETLTRIDEKMKNDIRQDQKIDDHEKRLRDLETRHP